ncbi:unnamed protein product, partial [Ostreobium quekettii]
AEKQDWGELTGWRMIAAEVMKDLDSSATAGETRGKSNGGEGGRQEEEKKCEPKRDGRSGWDVAKNRIQSVIAKSGSCFYVDFQLLDHIGSGAYGRAMKARRRSDGHLVVVKEVLIGRMSQKERLECKNEVKVLAHLNHPNVVKYYDCYSDSGKMHIVMEFCEVIMNDLPDPSDAVLCRSWTQSLGCSTLEPHQRFTPSLVPSRTADKGFVT